jgi:hypothetical protein
VRLLLLGALALLLAVGCGGEESALCTSLGDLEDSVGELQEIELGEGARDELRQSAEEIQGELEALQDAAGAELGPELADFEASARAMVAEIDATLEGELTRESLRTVAAAASAALADFDALQAAAPGC